LIINKLILIIGEIEDELNVEKSDLSYTINPFSKIL